MMERGDILTVIPYVQSLSGQEVEEGADLAAGATLFAENCASCHGEEGLGDPSLGAPKPDRRLLDLRR